MLTIIIKLGTVVTTIQFSAFLHQLVNGSIGKVALDLTCKFKVLKTFFITKYRKKKKNRSPVENWNNINDEICVADEISQNRVIFLFSPHLFEVQNC